MAALSQTACVAAAVGTVAGAAIGVTGAVVGGVGKAVVADRQGGDPRRRQEGPRGR
ncbi:hypothetical protein ACRAWD_02015 [Caulobacter segnis]